MVQWYFHPPIGRQLRFYVLENLSQKVARKWVVEPKETVLLACRIASFGVEFTDNSKRIAFEVWEAEERHRSRDRLYQN